MLSNYRMIEITAGLLMISLCIMYFRRVNLIDTEWFSLKTSVIEALIFVNPFVVDIKNLPEEYGGVQGLIEEKMADIKYPL